MHLNQGGQYENKALFKIAFIGEIQSIIQCKIDAQQRKVKLPVKLMKHATFEECVDIDRECKVQPET